MAMVAERRRPARGSLEAGTKPAPALVEGLEIMCNLAAASDHSFAVVQSGDVFRWGKALLFLVHHALRPIIVKGFGGVRVRRVSSKQNEAFAIGAAGELFSWGAGRNALLGNGNTRDQPSPNRVEALQSVRVSSVSIEEGHALALTEDGLVCA
jgi:RCC1 and BTB domain-containing protein